MRALYRNKGTPAPQPLNSRSRGRDACVGGRIGQQQLGELKHHVGVIDAYEAQRRQSPLSLAARLRARPRRAPSAHGQSLQDRCQADRPPSVQRIHYGRLGPNNQDQPLRDSPSTARRPAPTRLPARPAETRRPVSAARAERSDANSRLDAIPPASQVHEVGSVCSAANAASWSLSRDLAIATTC